MLECIGFCSAKTPCHGEGRWCSRPDDRSDRCCVVADAMQNGAKAAATAGVVAGALSLLEDGVEYRRSIIGGKEYAQRVAKRASTAAVVGGGSAFAATAISAVLPAAAIPVCTAASVALAV